jgi:hypothetical protein
MSKYGTEPSPMRLVMLKTVDVDTQQELIPEKMRFTPYVIAIAQISKIETLIRVIH